MIPLILTKQQRDNERLAVASRLDDVERRISLMEAEVVVLQRKN